VARAEHISIEATPDFNEAPVRQPHRRAIATFALKSSLRRSVTEVSILEDHYLAVRSQQSGEEPTKYVVDLRFANPRPLIVRHIAWIWLGIATALLLATGGCFWWAFASHGSPWTHPGAFVGSSGVIVAGASILMFLRRTTESLQFTSVHGGVTLINITAGIGSAKAGRRFFVEVIKNISAAKQARPQPRPQFLRDEMREHHRLRELNVLSEADYEASKGRILASHS